MFCEIVETQDFSAIKKWYMETNLSGKVEQFLVNLPHEGKLQYCIKSAARTRGL